MEKESAMIIEKLLSLKVILYSLLKGVTIFGVIMVPVLYIFTDSLPYLRGSVG